MGLTERHWFEDEEPELTDRQLEDIKKAYDNGYTKGFHDAKTLEEYFVEFGVKMGFLTLEKAEQLLKEKEYPQIDFVEKWITSKDNLPCDGAICDIIVSDDGKGLGILCATVKNGKFMLNGTDITDHVLKWHRLPCVVVDSNGIIQWDDVR